MVPELKITTLNIEKDFNNLLLTNDIEDLRISFRIANYILTDQDCIFIYDLADCVEAKDIDCYLRQYWKSAWEDIENYRFLIPSIRDELFDNELIRYSVSYSGSSCCHLYDFMFRNVTGKSSICPYAE